MVYFDVGRGNISMTFIFTLLILKLSLCDDRIFDKGHDRYMSVFFVSFCKFIVFLGDTVVVTSIIL